MALSGFEGFEKRLELHFSGDDPVLAGMGGLRQLDFESIEEVLNAVECSVVSAVGNQYFDSYVLSESSLFVYPTKIIIKTCGTTQLLKSILPLIQFSCELGFVITQCRYTRGNFIFPKAQPYPHTSFKDEIFYLQEQLPIHLCHKKASVMPSKFNISHSWHVFTACDKFYETPNDLFTVEICMTELDRVLARKFFKHPNMAAKEMTEVTGIAEINTTALICDFVFDPCGYSMNGIDGDRYSTIHVTPEDGFSYASYECVGSIYDDPNDIINMLNKAVQVFRPGTMSISTTSMISNDVWTRILKAVEPLGMKRRSCTMDDFPAAGSVVFQTFTSCRSREFNT